MDDNKIPKRTKPKDFAKIHKNHFDQMDSLDVYLKKKKKRAEHLRQTPKGVKKSVVTHTPQFLKTKMMFNFLEDAGPRHAATPFRFTAKTKRLQPTPRIKFDLKASLAKSLPYKPYTGKLPVPSCLKNSQKVDETHQRDFKTKSRNERLVRRANTQSRARESAISRRRGMANQ